MLLFVTFLWILIDHAHQIQSIDCEYSSREYQVVLRPDLVMNSFENGVMRLVDELTKIENALTIPFRISRSSLKLKNVSLVEYIPDDNRDSTDFSIPLIFKSRQKKSGEPADIVMKISNTDPTLACLPLTVAEDYINTTQSKFELDIHGENGRLLVKSAHSFTTDLSLEFDQTSAINISSILTDAAAKVTRSGQPLIIIPDSFGKVIMQTAEFNVNLAGLKSEAMIQYYRRRSEIKAEFSFRVKGAIVDRDILLVSQQLIAQLSRMPTIALYALIQPK